MLTLHHRLNFWPPNFTLEAVVRYFNVSCNKMPQYCSKSAQDGADYLRACQDPSPKLPCAWCRNPINRFSLHLAGPCQALICTPFTFVNNVLINPNNKKLIFLSCSSRPAGDILVATTYFLVLQTFCKIFSHLGKIKH